MGLFLFRMYGTLLFENQVLNLKYPNYLSEVLKNIDASILQQMEFFEKIEAHIEGPNLINLKEIYQNYYEVLKDFKYDEDNDTSIDVPFGEKRKRKILNYNTEPGNGKDQNEEITPKLKKKKKIQKEKPKVKNQKIELETLVKIENKPEGIQEEVNDLSMDTCKNRKF